MSGTMMSSSFLHSASAKIISERLRSSSCRKEVNNRPSAAYDPGDDSLRVAAETCRMLLVEDEGGDLARSLAMDAARSLASSSSSSSSFLDADPCRGCRPSGAGDDVDAAGAASGCRCCRVALLVAGGRPGKTRKGSSKRRRPSYGNGSAVTPPGNHAGRGAEFPMPCVAARRDGMDDDDLGGMDGGWDPVALGRISVKYVKTLSDVVKYLAYATSLPDHARPSRGIFLLGAGDCLPRQNVGMELVHLRTFCVYVFYLCFLPHVFIITRPPPLMLHQVSVLSDTASALEEKGRGRMKSINSVSEDPADHDEDIGGNIAVVATIDKLSYSSVPPKVVGYFRHWMDAIAAIEPARSVGRTIDAGAGTAITHHSEWKLAFKSASDQESSFAFRVNEIRNESDERDRVPSHQISWSL